MSGDALRLAILGSTGSIGRQAVDVALKFPDRVRVVALAAGSNAALLAEQTRLLRPDRVALADESSASGFTGIPPGTHLSSGPQAVSELATDADVVLNALVGAVGLRTTIRALEGGARLALANKESLVIGGDLVMDLVRPDTLIPVDSEHSAIHQCLAGEEPRFVSRIWLTASGGPFRGRTRESLGTVSVQEALSHPRWTMGPKITIDSATLMNKGLEAIEAHHLFGLGYDDIRVVVHPQSCIHSMVEFVDGSVKAHLGATDMRIPIQYAISYPARWDAPLPPVDFTQIGSLTFEEPDLETFRCLAHALEAGRTGGTMPAALNAANEVAVAAFLKGHCSFTDIDAVVASVVEAHDTESLHDIEQIEAVDGWARAFARDLLEQDRS